MVEDHLKEKYSAQTREIYRALGEFVVQFEHLMFTAKFRITMLCGLGKDTALLLEPYSARQTVELIRDIIQQRTGEMDVVPEDRELLKLFISDLRNINEQRNRMIHTNWLIGWFSEKDTDFSEAHGYKFTSPHHFKAHKVNAELFDSLSDRCRELDKVMHTMWPIDILTSNPPSFNSLFERSVDGHWAHR